MSNKPTHTTHSFAYLHQIMHRARIKQNSARAICVYFDSFLKNNIVCGSECAHSSNININNLYIHSQCLFIIINIIIIIKSNYAAAIIQWRQLQSNYDKLIKNIQKEFEFSVCVWVSECEKSDDETREKSCWTQWTTTTITRRQQAKGAMGSRCRWARTFRRCETKS